MWNKPTKKRLSRLPRLYQTSHIPLQEKPVYLHFFIGDCDWYIVEYDGVDTLWGFAIINGDMLNAEWGYMSLSVMKAIRVNNIYEIDCELEKHWQVRPAIEIEKIRKACGWHEVDMKLVEVSKGDCSTRP